MPRSDGRLATSDRLARVGGRLPPRVADLRFALPVAARWPPPVLPRLEDGFRVLLAVRAAAIFYRRFTSTSGGRFLPGAL